VTRRRGIVRDDGDALRLAKRRAQVSAVLFAIGAVLGTVHSFEMDLLWPAPMGRFGDVLGLPFALEGLSSGGHVGHRRLVPRGVGERVDEQSRRVHHR
jgi:cytochrome d ubiquinol oxidase subunit I